MIHETPALSELNTDKRTARKKRCATSELENCTNQDEGERCEPFMKAQNERKKEQHILNVPGETTSKDATSTCQR